MKLFDMLIDMAAEGINGVLESVTKPHFWQICSTCGGKLTDPPHRSIFECCPRATPEQKARWAETRQRVAEKMGRL